MSRPSRIDCGPAMRLGFSIALVIFINLAAAPAAVAVSRVIMIGSSPLGGIYYEIGRTICDLVGQNKEKNNLICRVIATPGSVFNLRALRAGDVDLAIAQSDWKYHAWHGSKKFRADGPDRTLRALAALHQESFTVMTRPGTSIHSFADMKYKRVNIGAPASGNNATALYVFQQLGWKNSQFIELHTEPTLTQTAALCAKRVDALIFVVGHPSVLVDDPARICHATLVPLSVKQLEKVIGSQRYYNRSVIRKNTYPTLKNDVVTFATTATLVTTKHMRMKSVRAVLEAFFANLEYVRRSVPALAQYHITHALRDGSVVPLHRAARKYYDQQSGKP